MGNLLITQEGVETSTIAECQRNDSLFQFYKMLDEAYGKGDSCFMTEAAYAHKYSYGECYPAFIHLSWEEFSQIPTLKGVSQGTYDYLTNNFQQKFPKLVTDKADFLTKSKPRGYGGFEHGDSPQDFLCSTARWKKWHIDYLTAHPEEIEWNPNHPFLPNIDAVYEILREEVHRYIERHYKVRIKSSGNVVREKEIIWNELFANSAYRLQGNATKPLKANAVALLFHREVMPSQNHKSMTSFCKGIGDRICKANYYQYEAALTQAEQKACGSQRRIYSILKDNRKQYISLDFHKGMFEFHNHRGEHLGEFHFDGTQNKGSETSHNFKTRG